MSDVKISDLIAITSMSDTDLLATSQDQGGGSYASKRVAFQTLKSNVKNVSVQSKTEAYTLTGSDDTVLADASGGAFTLTLPSASTVTGRVYHIKKTDSSGNAVTIDGNGAETIDGETSLDISFQYVSVTIVSDGSNWYII